MSTPTLGVSSTVTPHGQRGPRGKPRPKSRHKGGFVPSNQQVEAARELIEDVLSKTRLYACNAKDAAGQLLQRFGRKAHRLGKTAREKSVTVRRALADLVNCHRVRCVETRVAYSYCYKLA
jgi:hypothetical protein